MFIILAREFWNFLTFSDEYEKKKNATLRFDVKNKYQGAR